MTSGPETDTQPGWAKDTGAAGTDTSTDTGDGAGAKERAQQAASTAADETKKVAGVAATEVKNVAGEAQAHARNLVGEARSQVTEQVDAQSRQQKDLLASTLGTFGDDLTSMAESSSGLAADVAHQVAERARTLSQHLEGHEPSELLDDVRRYARQRPGTFLLGSLVAGVVVGRLLRGTADAIDAAEGGTTKDRGTPRVTPGAPDTTSVHAGHGQPTQPGSSSPTVGTAVPSAPTFTEGLAP